MRSYFTLKVVTPPATLVYRTDFGVRVFARHVKAEVERLGRRGLLRPGRPYEAVVLPGYGERPAPAPEPAGPGPHASPAQYLVTLRAAVDADAPDTPMTYFTLRLAACAEPDQPVFEQHYPLSAIASWSDAIIRGLQDCSVLPGEGEYQLAFCARRGEEGESHQEFARIADETGDEIAIGLSPTQPTPVAPAGAPPPNATVVGTPDPSGPAVYLSRGVLAQVQQQARAEPHREVAGLLLGRVSEGGPHPPRVEICRALPAEGVIADAVSVRFTAEAWQGILRRHAESSPEDRVVGWYHSHVGGGAARNRSSQADVLFMSAQDWNVHRHFRQPTDVALVLEAAGDGLAFFRWSGSIIVRCGGYHVYDEPGAEPGLAGE